VKLKNEMQGENLTKKEGRAINRDIFVFVFFLFLSFVFWYLNSLTKQAEADIKYPALYSNIPRERKILSEKTVQLDLSIRGSGYSILKMKFTGNKSPLRVDLSKVSYKRLPGSKSFEYYIISSNLAKSFSVQLQSGCEVTSVKPDTVFFTLDNQVVRAQPSGARK
jgi:hypothetical protein